MSENYLVNKSDVLLQEWNKLLNFEDMNHDSGKPLNELYIECRNSLFESSDFDENGSIDEPEGVYVKPYTIPKKIFSKPLEIKESFSIRDTEPAYKLYMNEKYTPAYYFDPASRTYPAEFPKSVTRFHNQTIDLKKYGLNSQISFQFINNSLKSVSSPTVLAVTVNIADGKFKDNYTQYIHKSGYSMGLTKSKKQLQIPNSKTQSPEVYNHLINQILILGNKEKDHFFKINESNKTPENIIRGKRMIYYKLLGDLLHAVFATPEDLVFTLDSYLRDRCIKNRVAIVAKEKNILDVIFDKKTKLYKVWIDKLYHRDKGTIYEIEGGIKSRPSKLNRTKSSSKTASKFKSASSGLSGKEHVLEGRDDVSNFLTVRKNGEKYRKIHVSCFNYHPVDGIINGGRRRVKGGIGKMGEIVNQDINILPEYHTLKGIIGTSIVDLLNYVKSKVETQQNLHESNIEMINQELQEEVQEESNIMGVKQHALTSAEEDILNLINTILENTDEKTMGKSDAMIDLIELLVDKTSMISEKDLEIYLLRSMCKDETECLKIINILNSLTNDKGLFVYDYRILNDFIENIDLIMNEEETVSIVEEETVPMIEEETVPMIEEDTVPMVEEDTVPMVEEEYPLDQNKTVFGFNGNTTLNTNKTIVPMVEEEDDLYKNKTVFGFNGNTNHNTIETYGGKMKDNRKTVKKRKNGRMKQKTRKRKTKRRQIKKNKISKKKRN